MAKRLVVCIDGTWNSADVESADTNVFRLASAVPAISPDGVQQSVLYLRGVGTAGLAAERMIEGAVGLGVDDLIRSAYMFVAQNHEPGDELFVFGFSRGAFSARSMVGMIAVCGLLERRSLGAIGLAWKHYRTPAAQRSANWVTENDVATRRDVRVRLLGVWDTVGALGVPASLLAKRQACEYAFHDTGPCGVIDFGCQALAIDEHRRDFVPTLWTGDAPAGTSIEQVWFAGAHADVGGGYADRSLADVPLLWMAGKAEEHGLALDRACLPATGDPVGPMHDSSCGTFFLDRFRPTWRAVLGRQVPVGARERLYFAIDATGRPAAGINESVHPSAIARLERTVRQISTSFPRGTGTIRYAPRTVQASGSGGSGKGGDDRAA